MYCAFFDFLFQARPNELEHLNAWSEDEAEENEPPLKRSKLSSQKRRSSTSFYASIPNSSNEVENQPHGMQKLPESIYIKHQDKYIELKAPRVSKYCHGNGKTSSSPPSLVVVEQAKETNFVSDDESDKSNSPAPLAHLETSGGESDIHYDFSEKRMITYERCHCTLFSDETGKLHDDIALEEEFDKHLHEAALECEPLSYDLPSFGVPPGALLYPRICTLTERLSISIYSSPYSYMLMVVIMKAFSLSLMCCAYEHILRLESSTTVISKICVSRVNREFAPAVI